MADLLIDANAQATAARAAGQASLTGEQAVSAIESQMLAPLAPGDIQQLTAMLQARIQALSPGPPAAESQDL